MRSNVLIKTVLLATILFVSAIDTWGESRFLFVNAGNDPASTVRLDADISLSMHIKLHPSDVFSLNESTNGVILSKKRTYAGMTETVTPGPTITLTDVTNPTLNTVPGVPVCQTLNISGVNLSVDLKLTISGADAGLFSLSQYSVTESAGNVPNTEVTITYTPDNPGTNTAILMLSSNGAMSVGRSLTGIAAIATDVSTNKASFGVISENGSIHFRATAGETVEIYNAIGQQLLHKLTVEGVNTIPVSARGVVLVKIGSRFAKVIL
ncbi:MAG: hypothetical protein Q8904_01150 [Bacteroidota bacterium]|nr:hypothetical protein [Bacteroidota bacterium]